MNFGQHWRTPNVPIVSYSLELPRAYFVAFLAEPENLADLSDDTRRYPDLTEPLDVALMANHFPTPEIALNDQTLAQELAQFYAHDLLLRWLGDGPVEVEPGFVLNSIELLAVDVASLRIAGKARPSGIEVYFQDV